MFFFLFTSKSAYAFRAIQLDQDRVRIITKPGITYSGKIEVKNPSDEEKQIRAYLQDWVYADDQAAKKFLPAGTVGNSCANWIKIVPQELTIPPFGKGYINYSVDIPENTSGGYYAILFCESLLGNPKISNLNVDSAAAVVPVAVRIGFLFAVEIKGASERKIEIKDLSIKRNEKLYEMTITYENAGNVDIKASGGFSIMDKNGIVSARGQFEDTYTMPKDKATFKGKWKRTLTQGKYDLILTIDLGRALEDMGMGRGPVIVREAELEVNENGDIAKIGEVK